MYSGTRPIIGLLGSEVSGCTIASPSPFPALARSSCRSPSGLKCLGNERRFLPHIPQGALHLGHWVHVLDLVRVLARAGVHRLAPKVTVTCGHSLSRLVIGIQDISHRHPGHSTGGASNQVTCRHPRAPKMMAKSTVKSAPEKKGTRSPFS